MRADLTPEQDQAVRGVRGLVGEMAEQWGRAPLGPPPRDRQDGVGNPILEELLDGLDPGRSSLTVLIDGARGAGKTTTLLTLIDGWLRAPGDARSPAIIPLHPLDLRRIGPKSDLLMLLLVRMHWVVQALARTPRAPYAQDELDEAWNGAAQAAIAFRRDGGEYAAGAESVDVPLAAFELAERAQLSRSLNERFQTFVGKLASAYQATFGRRPFWIIPVDDADLNPARTHELLDLVRVLHHPGVAVVITGNYSLFRRALVSTLGRELGIQDRPENNAYVVRLARDILRRTLPPSHTFALRPLDLTQVEELASGVEGELTAAGAFGLFKPLEHIRLRPGTRADVAALFRRFSVAVPPTAELRLGVLLPDSLRRLQDVALDLKRLRTTFAERPDELLYRLLRILAQEIYLSSLEIASKESGLPSPEALRHALEALLDPPVEARRLPVPNARDDSAPAADTRRAGRRIYVDPDRHALRSVPGRGDVYSSTGTPDAVLLHLDRPPRRLAPTAENLSHSPSEDLDQTLQHPRVNALVASFVGLLSDLAARGAPGVVYARAPANRPTPTWIVHSSFAFEGTRLRFPWLLPAWQGTIEVELLGDAWFTLFEADRFSGWVHAAPGARAAVWRSFVESVRLASEDAPAAAWSPWLEAWRARLEQESSADSALVDASTMFAEASKEQPGAPGPWGDWVASTQLLHLAPEYGLPPGRTSGLTVPLKEGTRRRLQQLREAAIADALERAGLDRGRVKDVLARLKERDPGHPWYAYVERSPNVAERVRTAIGDAQAARPKRLPRGRVPFRDGALGRFVDAYLGSTRRLALLAALDPDAVEAIPWEMESSASAASVLQRLREAFPGPNVGATPMLLLDDGPELTADATRYTARRPHWTAVARESAAVELLRLLQADVDADESGGAKVREKPFWWAGMSLDLTPHASDAWGWPGPRWPAEIDNELVWDHWSSALDEPDLDLDRLARQYLHGVNAVGYSRATPAPELTPPAWGPLLEIIFRQSKTAYDGVRWAAWQRWRDELVLMAAPLAGLGRDDARALIDAWSAWLRGQGRNPDVVFGGLKLPVSSHEALRAMVADDPQHPFCVLTGRRRPATETDPPE